MIEIDGVVWIEATVRGVIEERDRHRVNLEDLRLKVAQQVAEVVRIKIDNARHQEQFKQLVAENKALKELSAIDRKRAQEAASNERVWRGQAVQLRYELEALKESLKKPEP
jgi:hypothetical protein